MYEKSGLVHGLSLFLQGCLFSIKPKLLCYIIFSDNFVHSESELCYYLNCLLWGLSYVSLIKLYQVIPSCLYYYMFLMLLVCAYAREIGLKQSPWGNGDEFFFLNNILTSSQKVNSLCQLGFWLKLITRIVNLNSSAIAASSTFNSWIKSECLGSVPTFFFRNTASRSECCLCCCCCFISTIWGKGRKPLILDG